MAPEAPRPGVSLLDALRRRWWLVAGTPAATATLALLFVLMVRPLFEARTSLRFTESRGPLEGAVPSAGEGGGLSLLASLAGRSVPIQTEMAVLASESLGAALVDELGLRMEVRRPARVARSRLFDDVRVAPDAAEGDYELVRTPEGAFRLTGDILVERDPFKPFLNERRERRDLGTVAPGRALPLDGARIVLAGSAADVERIRFRILSPADALERFQDRLVVARPEREANVIEVGVRWHDPELAATAADLLARRYVEERERVQAEELGRTAGFLTFQLDSLREELAGAEDALRSYREARGIIEPQAQAEAAVTQLAELQARRDQLAAEREALLELLRRIEAEPAAAGEAMSPYRKLVFFPTLLQNSATAEMLRLLGELENERAGLLGRRTNLSRDVEVISARVRGLEDQLRSVAVTYLEGLENQVASVDRLLAAFHGELARVPAVELEYARRRRLVEVLNQLYVFMQVRQKEAEVSAAGGLGGVRILDPAMVPYEPVRPRPALTLALALIVGLVLGVGGAVVLEHARTVTAPRGA